MKDLQVIIENREGRLLVSSRVVAEQLGKQHSHVMDKCREVLGLSEFCESSYINAQNKEQPELLLTKDGFILLCMNYQGYNDFKRAYIAKFNEMERIILKKSLQKVDLSKDIKKQFDIVDKIAWANKTGNTELVKLSLLKIQSSTGYDMSDYLKFLGKIPQVQETISIRDQVKLFLKEIKKNINKYPDDRLFIHLPPGEETRICNELNLNRLDVLRELASTEKIKVSFSHENNTMKRLYTAKSKFHDRKRCVQIYSRVLN